MHRIETNSIRREIKTGKHDCVAQIAKRMIAEWNELPLVFFFDLKQRILNGLMLEEDLHVGLIVHSKSLTLYQNRSYYSNQGKQEFLKAGIPDKNIEIKLAEVVADDLRANRLGNIRNLLETLRDYGSLACLNILEVVDYDISTRIQVAQIKNQLFGGVSIKDPSPKDFVTYAKKYTTTVNLMLARLLKDSIREIRNRDASPESMSCPWSTL